MLVEYSKPNIVHFPITTKEKNIAKMITLAPGVNEVSAADWKEVEKLPKVQRLISEGDTGLTVITDADPKKDVGSLADMDVGQAILVVRKTYNPDLLSKWLISEKREGVGAEINKQIADIKAKTTRQKKTN